MNSQDRPLRTSTFLPFAFCLQCVSNEDNLLMHTCGAGARGFSAICRRAEDEAWGAGGVPASPVLGAEATTDNMVWRLWCNKYRHNSPYLMAPLGFYLFAVCAICGCLGWGAVEGGLQPLQGQWTYLTHSTWPWAAAHVETWQSAASSFKAVLQYLWVINEIKELGYREWQMQFVQHWADIGILRCSSGVNELSYWTS